MSRNRRRHQNPLPVRSLSPWLLIAVIVLLGGMTRVYMKNRLVARGKEITEMEKQLDELQKQNKSLLPRIATLSSRTSLQKRLNDGFIKMMPIAQDRVVQVNFSHSSSAIARAGDEIVPVSNPGGGR